MPSKEAIAQKVAMGSCFALALTLGFGAALTRYSRVLMPAVFVFFMGLAMVSWGVVMIPSILGDTGALRRRLGRGTGGFATRAFRLYGFIFLVVWFVAGAGLMVTGVVLAVR